MGDVSHTVRTVRRILAAQPGRGADIERDEWGVPLDADHERATLHRGEVRLPTVLGGRPQFSLLRRLSAGTWAMTALLGVTILIPLTVLAGQWAVERWEALTDPPAALATEQAPLAEPAWSVPAPAQVAAIADEEPWEVRAWFFDDLVVYADPRGATGHALDDGAAVWEHTHDHTPCGMDRGRADDRLVLLGQDEGGTCTRLTAIDPGDGAELWRVALPPPAAAQEAPPEELGVWSMAERTLVAAANVVAAVDPATGDPRWHTTLAQGCAVQDLREGPEGAEVVLLADCEHGLELLGVESAGGDRVWGGPLPPPFGAEERVTHRLVSADPVVVGTEGAYADGGDTHFAVFENGEQVRRIEGGAGLDLPEFHSLGVDPANYVVHGGLLYAATRNSPFMDHGIIVAIDLHTGEEHWRMRLPDEALLSLVSVHEGAPIGLTGDGEEHHLLAFDPDGADDPEVLAAGVEPPDGIDCLPCQSMFWDGATLTVAPARARLAEGAPALYGVRPSA